jgi:hypothetical protein
MEDLLQVPEMQRSRVGREPRAFQKGYADGCQNYYEGRLGECSVGIHNRQGASVSLVDTKALSGKFGMRTILGSHSGAPLMRLLVSNCSLLCWNCLVQLLRYGEVDAYEKQHSITSLHYLHIYATTALANYLLLAYTLHTLV